MANAERNYNNFRVSEQKNNNFYTAMACRHYFAEYTDHEYKCAYGKDSSSQSKANEYALMNCNKWSGWGDVCHIIMEGDKKVLTSAQYWEKSRQKKLLEDKAKEKAKFENYISQCEQIGFKRNTEKMGDCVLKISQTEKQIISNKGASDNSLVNLLILQESLKLLNPPTQPNRNIRCNYNTVGGIGTVNCF